MICWGFGDVEWGLWVMSVGQDVVSGVLGGQNWGLWDFWWSEIMSLGSWWPEQWCKCHFLFVCCCGLVWFMNPGWVARTWWLHGASCGQSRQ